MLRSIGVVLAGMGLVGCSMNTMVADGQLFCAKATQDGPLTVALADASGAPIIVTGLASAVVAADCALVDAIPVTPPPATVTVPVVAVAAVSLKPS